MTIFVVNVFPFYLFLVLAYNIIWKQQYLIVLGHHFYGFIRTCLWPHIKVGAFDLFTAFMFIALPLENHFTMYLDKRARSWLKYLLLLVFLTGLIGTSRKLWPFDLEIWLYVCLSNAFVWKLPPFIYLKPLLALSMLLWPIKTSLFFVI